MKKVSSPATELPGGFVAFGARLICLFAGALSGCTPPGNAVTPPSPPDAPTISAVKAAPGKAVVSWTGVAHASSYNIYYAAGSTVSPAAGNKVSGAASGATVSGLTNDTEYAFVVTAVGSGGESQPSTVVTATPEALNYLYVTNYRSNGPKGVSEYSLANDGTITALGNADTANDEAVGIVTTPDGKHVYVANETSDACCTDTLAIYGVQPGGALSSEGTMDTTNASGAPNYLAVSPDGKYLYATLVFANLVQGYVIGSDGTLAENGTADVSPGVDPNGIVISGNNLYTAEDSGDSSHSNGCISEFKIQTNGSLTSNGTFYSSNLQGPEHLAATPDGAYLYVTNSYSSDGSGGISFFSINTDGTLSWQADYNTGSSGNPQGLAVTPDGRYLYVVNGMSSGTNGISIYSIQSDGTLTSIGAADTASIGTPEDIAIRPDGKFLYVTNYGPYPSTGTDGVEGFSIAADGSLKSIGTADTGPDGNPWGIAIATISK